MPGPLLILGATSDIGGELARLLCSGRDCVLAARRPEAVAELVADLRSRGALSVTVTAFEATETTAAERVVDACKEATGQSPEIAVVAFGILGDQSRAEEDPEQATDIATIDYTAQIAALTTLSQAMSRGYIVAFSSIAGWRPRRANYVYGSTKAGLDAFCQGLTDALRGTDLQIITARPGFVIGSMTEGMKPAPLSVYPHDVAETVASHIRAGKRSATLWIPRQLRLLAWIMRLIPRPVWARMPR
ncbi:short-chain dehydrogenase/reductase [Corynebacterium renale]|uniref:SDR family oxidoreductase n=1 Tax=Corynebacterium renale TaxID=1724 RepID=UPI000DA2ECB1|nr:SDR family oxidoreductase [Corynebacterium renale]SQG64674.1 short-chain dehydrogenase/reductase [Corynebacterium renale]STC95882.1 short-chain dehydrogenase/reductase [Corynebacterium renale]